jgi:hypothetical protein
MNFLQIYNDNKNYLKIGFLVVTIITLIGIFYTPNVPTGVITGLWIITIAQALVFLSFEYDIYKGIKQTPATPYTAYTPPQL